MTSKIKLFISTQLDPNSELTQFCCEQNWKCTGHSFLSFNQLNFENSSEYDVVFFASPRSYHYFISRSTILKSADIAVLGEGTKRSINDKNSSVKFVGQNSGNPENVALNFKQWLGKRTVLFPIAKHSNESISRHIPDHQKIVLPVYETIIEPKAFGEFSIYVFTSPSNVSGFLEKNQLTKGALVIAWGKTTAKFCLEKGIAIWETLEESSMEALIQVLKLRSSEINTMVS